MSKPSAIWSLVFGPLVERLASTPWWKRPILLPFLWLRNLGLLGGAVAILSVAANFKGVFDDNASARQVTELHEEVAQMRALLDVVKLALDSRATQLDAAVKTTAECDPQQLRGAADALRKLSDKLTVALRVHGQAGATAPLQAQPASPARPPRVGSAVAPAPPPPLSPAQPDAEAASPLPPDSTPAPADQRPDRQQDPPSDSGVVSPVSAAIRPVPPAASARGAPKIADNSAKLGRPIALDQTVVTGDEPYTALLLNVASPQVVGPDGKATTAQVEKVEILQPPTDSRVILVFGDDETKVASGRITAAQLMGLKAKFITDGCGGSTSFRYRVWYGGQSDDATFNIVRNRVKPANTCPNDDRSAPANR